MTSGLVAAGVTSFVALPSTGTAATVGAASAGAGTAVGWGSNSSGQLATGATSVQHTPPTRIGLAVGTVTRQLSSSGGHTLALTSDGSVYAWGNNGYSELGGGYNTSPDPIAHTVGFPGTSTPIVQVAAGHGFSLALSSTGQLWSWGDAKLGGNATDVDPASGAYLQISWFEGAPYVPLPVPAGVTVTAVSAGWDHALALTSTGGVLAWGSNDVGQLGDGTSHFRLLPVPISLPAGVKAAAVTAGARDSFVVTTTGRVYAWGHNNAGQLGDGTTVDRLVPTKVLLPTGIAAAQVASAPTDTFAVTTAGGLLSWGSNLHGQLGVGTTASHNTPLRPLLPAGTTVASVSADADVALATTTTGQVLGWGDRTSAVLLPLAPAADVTTPTTLPLPDGTFVHTVSVDSYVSGPDDYKLWPRTFASDTASAVVTNPAPVVTSLDPPSMQTDVPMRVTVTGKYLSTVDVATVDGNALQPELFHCTSENRCTVDLYGPTPGVHAIALSGWGGYSLDTPADHLTVLPDVDLTPTSLVATPEHPSAGQPVVFRATVKNNGPIGAAPATVDFRVGGTVVASTSTGPLGAGASATVVATTAWTAQSGTATVTVAVDPTNAIPELSETNNTLSVPLVVAPMPTSGLFVSTSPDRSGAYALDQGLLPAGNLYLFWAPAPGSPTVTSVAFFLDGVTTATHTETLAPWDFEGGSADTATFWRVNGTGHNAIHTLRAVTTYAGGATATSTATFFTF